MSELNMLEHFKKQINSSDSLPMQLFYMVELLNENPLNIVKTIKSFKYNGGDINLSGLKFMGESRTDNGIPLFHMESNHE